MGGGHISADAIGRLEAALCALQTADEAHALLCDLLTPHELEDLAQRLEVAALLDEGVSYATVSKRVGVSSTTVSRVSKCLNGGSGGYRLVLDRLAQERLARERPEQDEDA